mmetsp:Transcript_17699/g.8320  ORF Transcript_17699/g.8320 Transcript_17699/m.8320 type:complete len:126 (-) Transcript_17699:144-521(-)
MIASGDKDGDLKLWDVYTTNLLTSIAVNKSVTAICFTKDNKFIVSGTSEGIDFWSTSTYLFVKKFTVQTELISVINFTHDDEWMAIGGDEGEVEVHSMAEGHELIFNIIARNKKQILAVEVSEDK